MPDPCPDCGHPLTAVCTHCRAAAAGRVTSPTKAAAARRNGKRGGRPKSKLRTITIASGLKPLTINIRHIRG